MNQDLMTLICLFHHPDQAQAAFEDVLRANVPEENVSLIGQDAGDPTALSRLADFELPRAELHRLLDGVEQGGVVLAVRSLSHLEEKVEAIFKAHRASALDEGSDAQVPLHLRRGTEHTPEARAVAAEERSLSGEQIFEFTETREELEVTRSARMVEEIVVSRVSGEHVEHVHDTLRHTEVEVEQISPDGASRRAQHELESPAAQDFQQNA